MTRELRTSTVHSPLLTAGSRWLYHLSLHCLPFLSPKTSPILVHPIPYWATNSLSFSSCSAVHISAVYSRDNYQRNAFPTINEIALVEFSLLFMLFLKDFSFFSEELSPSSAMAQRFLSFDCSTVCIINAILTYLNFSAETGT